LLTFATFYDVLADDGYRKKIGAIKEDFTRAITTVIAMLL